MSVEAAALDTALRPSSCRQASIVGLVQTLSSPRAASAPTRPSFARRPSLTASLRTSVRDAARYDDDDDASGAVSNERSPRSKAELRCALKPSLPSPLGRMKTSLRCCAAEPTNAALDSLLEGLGGVMARRDESSFEFVSPHGKALLRERRRSTSRVPVEEPFSWSSSPSPSTAAVSFRAPPPHRATSRKPSDEYDTRSTDLTPEEDDDESDAEGYASHRVADLSTVLRLPQISNPSARRNGFYAGEVVELTPRGPSPLKMRLRNGRLCRVSPPTSARACRTKIPAPL